MDGMVAPLPAADEGETTTSYVTGQPPNAADWVRGGSLQRLTQAPSRKRLSYCSCL